MKVFKKTVSVLTALTLLMSTPASMIAACAEENGFYAKKRNIAGKSAGKIKL